ncbi:MAG: hypothetical protein U9R74_15595 [Pseudomonadota bacterium]|nr:hypothetical protein [Pseudomonadota bacterium]
MARHADQVVAHLRRYGRSAANPFPAMASVGIRLKSSMPRMCAPPSSGAYACAFRTLLACFVLLFTIASGASAERCTGCHRDRTAGFSDGHGFGSEQCSTCHGGDPDAEEAGTAHRDMLRFPGDLASAARVCAPCHADKVASVSKGLMHTGAGMIAKTRDVFGEASGDGPPPTFEHLTTSPADSLLRKLCASCHLGQEKRQHALDPVRDRGGGCLACHINGYPDDAHPPLSARVEDARCFGCHSRSGRISLSYAGLAEVDGPGVAERAAGRLPDGRLVASLPAGVHHAAGMACIDCHTGRGLMGGIGEATYQSDAVDIACEDCHRNRNPWVTLDTWRKNRSESPPAPPFPVDDERTFLTTARGGSVLWHIELRDDGAYLHRKIRGGRIRIPELSADNHPPGGPHERLTCSACHARWAPRCIGCHVGYDDSESQWDHVEQSMTPGRWRERRWDIGTGEPTLGVTAGDRIAPFVPGMILTIEDRDTGRSRFQRRFARSAPHTTGAARSCDSCHASSETLGLGAGRLEKGDSGWRFTPAHAPAPDGLPADAWTGFDPGRTGRSSLPGERSLAYDEMVRILEALPLPGAKPDSR